MAITGMYDRLPEQFEKLQHDSAWLSDVVETSFTPASVAQLMQDGALKLKDANAFFGTQAETWREFRMIGIRSSFRAMPAGTFAQFVADQSGKNVMIVHVMDSDSAGEFATRNVYLAYPNESGKMQFYNNPSREAAA